MVHGHVVWFGMVPWSIWWFSAMGVSFLLAFSYYIRIYLFARKEAAEFEAALAAAQASHHAASENGTSINCESQ